MVSALTERSTDGGGTLLFQGTYVYTCSNNRSRPTSTPNGTGTTVTRVVYSDQGTLFADLTRRQTRCRPATCHQDKRSMRRLSRGLTAWGRPGCSCDRLGLDPQCGQPGSGTLIGTGGLRWLLAISPARAVFEPIQGGDFHRDWLFCELQGLLGASNACISVHRRMEDSRIRSGLRLAIRKLRPLRREQ